ncbi:MAG: hypothetical protein MR346_11300 [Clostridium sp.]|nr:hypothetical protein [Clostridium sp.]
MIKKISIADKETLDIVNASVSDNKNTLSNMDTSMNNLNAKVDNLNSGVDEIKNSNSGTGYVMGADVHSIPSTAPSFLNISGKGILNAVMYQYGYSSETVTFYLQVDGGTIKKIDLNKNYITTYVFLLPFKNNLSIWASEDSIVVSYQLFE